MTLKLEHNYSVTVERPRAALQTPLTLSRLMLPVIILTIHLLLSLVITAGVCGYIRSQLSNNFTSFHKFMQFENLGHKAGELNLVLTEHTFRV